MKYLVLLACLFLLLGCAAPAPEEEGCNECLEEAFVNCKEYENTWNGENGDWEVEVLEQEGEDCIVFVRIPPGELDISGTRMQCNVPLDKEAEFDIQEDCSGSLVKYFSD